MSTRKTFIDIAKGIGIILVVLGHLDANGQMSRNFIYSFHIPLFFFLSGLFVRTTGRFSDYARKYVKTVYLPYACFVLFDIILTAVINLLSGKNPFLNFSQKLLTFAGLKLSVMNIALWFLFALFLIHMVFYFVNKNKVIKFAALFASVAFVALSGYCKLPHYFLWLIAIPGLGFYILGNVLKNAVFSLEEKVSAHKGIYTAVCVLLFILLFFTSNQNLCVDTTLYKYGNPALYYINAVLGILATLILSVLLSGCDRIEKGLTFYGRNSIYILVTHYYICRSLVRTIMAKAGLWDYVYSPQMQIFMLAVMLLLSVPWISFASKHLGFVFGKNRKKGSCCDA